MKDRRAASVVFGFDFQVCAAIVLMLDNIKDMKSLRLEGNQEDIELKLSDDKYILAQAKAVVHSSYDFANVRANLKKALTSLSEGNQKVDTKELIFITNSLNPFNEEASRAIFYGPTYRSFWDLPPSTQKIITDYLSDIDNHLDSSKFSIQVIPYETDNDKERLKVVMQTITDFIGTLNVDSAGLPQRLFEIWKNSIFINGSKADADICLDKKDIIWPIIVIVTDVERMDNPLQDLFDPSEYDEIVRKYKSEIDSLCERIEFFTKVLWDYSTFKGSRKPSEKPLEFIEKMWKNYSPEFDIEGMSPEIIEGLTKIVLFSILRRKYQIDSIKREVNL